VLCVFAANKKVSFMFIKKSCSTFCARVEWIFLSLSLSLSLSRQNTNDNMTPAPSSAFSGKEEGEETGQTKTNTIATTESAYANEYYTRMIPSSCDWSEENILAVGCDAGPFVLLIVRFVVLNSFLLRNQYHNSADLVHSFLFLYDDRIPHKSTRRIPVQRRRV
jgi:hypothetical protein